ncbi:hypothetical protein D1007_35276 [Hordeum vulgare]|nr:hypothetical protein D1007_35276 [Hordeum vulgare]
MVKPSLGKVAYLTNMPTLQPEMWSKNSGVMGWIENCHNQAEKEKKKGTLTLLHLVPWELWKDRNRRTFQLEALSVEDFINRVCDEIMLWNLVGAGIPFDPG